INHMRLNEMNSRLRNETQNNEFTSDKRPSSIFCGRAREYHKDFQGTLFFTLMLCLFAIPSLAQNPVASRGEQLLSISQGECMSRARAALQAEGYKFLTDGTYSSIFGGKSINTAGILCNPAPENKMWVNIVVASVHNDMNVPGAERVKLQ